MLKTVVTAVCFCVFDYAIAEPVPLSGKMLSEMIKGADVELDAPLGAKIPIRYGDDGRMTGRAGALSFYLGASADAGRWWVAGDQLCQKWEKWFDGETQCLRIRKEGSRIHWVSRDGKSGTGTVQVRIAHAPESVRASPSKPTVVAALAPSREASKVPARLPEPSKLGAPEPEFVVASLPQPEAPAAKLVPRFSRPVVELPKEDAQAPQDMTPQHMAQAVQVEPQEPKPKPKPKPKIEARPPATPAAPVVAAAAPAATPGVATDAVPRFMVVRVDAADVLNVREGPSADHDIVGAIPPQGRGVAMTGTCRQQWCPVRHGVLTGWVNRAYLESEEMAAAARARAKGNLQVRDNPEAPRKCLTPAARELLERIETRFGPMQLVSTCRPGATIAGSSRLSRHSSGNAIDFNPGARKQAVVEWLVANHHGGGTMTYRDMDHVHVDIGSHFVALGASSGVRRVHYNSYAQSNRSE